MHRTLEQIGRLKVIPVVSLADAGEANPLADALLGAGLPCVEVTFRTTAAAASIRLLSQRAEILVGAGTVLRVDQARTAVEAGAAFLVSPGFNPAVVRFCLDQGIPVTPGVCTPSEIATALDFGLEVVKFFPAEAFGGLNTLKAVSAPFPAVRFIPTGGIGPSNLIDYLRFPRVLACGGTWIAPPERIAKREYAQIRRLAHEAVRMAAAIDPPGGG